MTNKEFIEKAFRTILDELSIFKDFKDKISLEITEYDQLPEGQSIAEVCSHKKEI